MIPSISMVLPDNNAEDYTLPFLIGDKWYCIYAHSRPTHYTALWDGNSLVLKLSRFYSITLDDDLPTKVENIVDKLKTLLLFL